jgi:hypothetical protein
MEIRIDGLIYRTKKSNEATAKEVQEKVYENFSDMDKLQCELDDGGFFVMGKAALQRSQIIFYDDNSKKVDV